MSSFDADATFICIIYNTTSKLAFHIQAEVEKIISLSPTKSLKAENSHFCITDPMADPEGRFLVFVWLASHMLPYLSLWVGCRL